MLLLTKSDIPATDSKTSNPLILNPCGLPHPMIPGGFPFAWQDYSPDFQGRYSCHLSPSVNRSGLLVVMDYGCLSCCVIQTKRSTPDGMRVIYRNYFRRKRLIYERQRSRFDPNTVVMSRLVCWK